MISKKFLKIVTSFILSSNLNFGQMSLNITFRFHLSRFTSVIYHDLLFHLSSFTVVFCHDLHLWFVTIYLYPLPGFTFTICYAFPLSFVTIYLGLIFDLFDRFTNTFEPSYVPCTRTTASSTSSNAVGTATIPQSWPARTTTSSGCSTGRRSAS